MSVVSQILCESAACDMLIVGQYAGRHLLCQQRGLALQGAAPVPVQLEPQSQCPPPDVLEKTPGVGFTCS